MGTNETAGGSGNTGPSEFKDSNTGHAHDNYVNCSAAGDMTHVCLVQPFSVHNAQTLSLLSMYCMNQHDICGVRDLQSLEAVNVWLP